MGGLLIQFKFYQVRLQDYRKNQGQNSYQYQYQIYKFEHIRFLRKTYYQLFFDASATSEVKKICIRVMKNINMGGGGRQGSGNSSGLNKIKSEYIPSMLKNLLMAMGQKILELLCTGSPDQKLTALEYLSQNNFESIQQATVRSDYYQKLTYIFTIKKLKTKKHITFFNQCLSKLIVNTSKDQSIQIIQKDILKRIHNFMLDSPQQTHSACLQYLAKIVKISAANGMLNLQKCIDYFKSPYPEFVKIIIGSVLVMSQKLGNISAIRFIPGIRDYITLCLKTNSQQLSLDLLKIMSNISLDEQCRYQILNLKGMDVLVKFLQTTQNQQISRVSAKGLLNLAISSLFQINIHFHKILKCQKLLLTILDFTVTFQRITLNVNKLFLLCLILSSRQNKAKVLGFMSAILERYYRMQFDSITYGYIDTILKSKNI